MRVRIALVLVVATAALVGACSKSSGTGTATPSTPAATTPASNGVAELPADQILAKANEALARSGPYHVKGEVTSEGTKTSMDLRANGKDIHVIFKVDDLEFEVISVGGYYYVKGIERLPGSDLPSAVSALVTGKFVKFDQNDPRYSGVVEGLNGEDLMKATGTLSKGELTTINGTPAIGLVDSSDHSIVYIATIGEPLPLRGESASGEIIDFSYHESFVISAPPATEVVDASVLPR